MNPLNLKALDSKEAKRAVVANRKIGMNRNVNANSASARSRLAAAKEAVAAKGAVAAKNVAAANKAVSKAADDKPCVSDQRAAGGDSRRFFCARIAAGSSQAKLLPCRNRNHGRRVLPAMRRSGLHPRDEARFALISQNAQAIFRQRS